MKLWQKIYLFSLIVVITTVSLSGHLLIQNFHNSVLKKEIEKSISEEKFLALEFKLNDRGMLEAGYNAYIGFEASINELMNHYAETMQYEGYFQILDREDKLIYTDFNFPLASATPELDGVSYSKMQYLIRVLDGHYYLYTSGMVAI